MKSRHLITFILIATILTGCHKDSQIDPKTPSVTNQTVEVSATAATFRWTVDWLGKFASIVEVCENEDMSDSQTYGSETETADHSFMATATGLKEATGYYYRFLVWNKDFVDKKFKTEVKNFTTKSDVPKVKTTEVTDVTRTTATIICEVTDESGASVTERGVCWGTTQNPTTSGNHLSNGNGMGIYSVAITGLETGKTYYARAYAKNVNGTAYGEELSFVTGDAVKPTVTTADVSNIDWRTATGGGTVTDDGDATVTERGICWSTSHDPSVNGSHASSGTGTGNYTVNMTGLTAGTTYYVRAYAKNQAGVGYGNEASFVTKSPEKPTVTTESVTSITYKSATGNGNVISDGGTEINECGFYFGLTPNPSVTGAKLVASSVGNDTFSSKMNNLESDTVYYVCAYATNSVGTSYGREESFHTPYEGPAIVTTADVSYVGSTIAICGGNVAKDGSHTVTERGVCWSTGHNPDISGSHMSSGSGIGSFTCSINNLDPETQYYLRAYATNIVETSYGNEVCFTTGVALTFPTGSINGLFSVSDYEQVCFSQGNLQYQASTNTWRFADHQYDVIGDSNSNISSSYSGWIDLFGWGTSGWNSGAVCYQPWSTGTDNSDYYPGGSFANDLTGDYANADWGIYNAISNGGNQAGQWRTLTIDEWEYVFNTRNTPSGIRYAKARVNGVNGMILLPDNWSVSCYSLSSTNDGGADYNSNTISSYRWLTLEQYGAVFLPTTGYREGTYVDLVGYDGTYWSASSNDSGAYGPYFGETYQCLTVIGSYSRYFGCSVRLVRSAQ